VRHHGAPVWIEGIENDTAEIRYLNSDKKSRVSLAELVEG
jgi:hypothetical protein